MGASASRAPSPRPRHHDVSRIMITHLEQSYDLAAGGLDARVHAEHGGAGVVVDLAGDAGGRGGGRRSRIGGVTCGCEPYVPYGTTPQKHAKTTPAGAVSRVRPAPLPPPSQHTPPPPLHRAPPPASYRPVPRLLSPPPSTQTHLRDVLHAALEVQLRNRLLHQPHPPPHEGGHTARAAHHRVQVHTRAV